MYPNLYYAFKDLFGVEWTRLRFVNSFGFFVALSFLAAAFVLTQELKRKERAGKLHGLDVKILVGKPAGIGELVLNFFLGFLLGYKILGLLLMGGNIGDPQEYFFSTDGNWPVGLATGALFAFLKWREKNKQKQAQPEERTIRIWPHDRVGDLVIYAALFGFLGAKVFHNLENWDDFIASPIEALLSFSGLTFYGGLICAALAIFFYARRNKISFRHLADGAAPALMLAYAVGRIGCQVGGDGDWGILNSAYVTDPVTSKAVPADTIAFNNALHNHSTFYLKTFRVDSLSQIPHKTAPAPSWLPTWMFAYSYPHNVIGEGTRISGCDEQQYCSHLPVPVFPTPFYETVMGLLLFLLLWFLRTRLAVPGTLFAVYLVVNGIERFFIEKIRVNTKYHFGSFHPTQAELISSLLVIGGIVLYVVLTKRSKNAERETSNA
ncbi:MAG: prolipoprotein diacylglyceryl transferase [Chitinophagaceae bacterium]